MPVELNSTSMTPDETNILSVDHEKLIKKTNKRIGVALIVFSILNIALAIYAKTEIAQSVIGGIVNLGFAMYFLDNERKAKKWFTFRLAVGFIAALGVMVQGSIFNVCLGGVETLFFIYIFILYFGEINVVKYRIANQIILPLSAMGIIIGCFIEQKIHSSDDEIGIFMPKYESVLASIEKYKNLIPDTVASEQISRENFSLEDSAKLLKSYFLTIDDDVDYLSRFANLDSNDRGAMNNWKEETKEIKAALIESK